MPRVPQPAPFKPDLAFMALSADLALLIARIALGDRAAFRQLYDATAPSLLGVALRIVRDRGRAEDVLQDAFVNVWHRAGSYREAAGAPLSWLTAIVRNRALDALRSESRHPTDSLTGDEDEMTDIEDDRPDPLGLLTQAADALAIRACLETIDGSQRQCLALAYYHGLTHAEMAAHLGSPIGSVKVWLRRGLEKIRRCLERAK
ncbi:MAG TPA: sigma-70 family RNA polymerase sigma factor [Casimicrobiaceae bacterium]|jgi:RNA polymerase sigma-70 factor (ECF subfamily)|nr:sigma-70 family RNA polymerase sigma factor [Casimicrobiaceae bacterium]